MTVALADGIPEAHGRTWTAEDYAKRDAAMAALGITFTPRSPRAARASHSSSLPS